MTSWQQAPIPCSRPLIGCQQKELLRAREARGGCCIRESRDRRRRGSRLAGSERLFWFGHSVGGCSTSVLAHQQLHAISKSASDLRSSALICGSRPKSKQIEASNRLASEACSARMVAPKLPPEADQTQSRTTVRCLEVGIWSFRPRSGYNLPFVLGNWPAIRGSCWQAVSVARANALNSASTM